MCLSSLPYKSIASAPSSQNGNPERGHDFEQRIAALVADIEKMAPNLKAIEKLVMRSKSEGRHELILIWRQAHGR